MPIPLPETLSVAQRRLIHHAPLRPGRAYRKVRADHAAETAQDYVEAVSDLVHRQGICRVKHLAEHMGVSHVTVSRIISRLLEEQLVESRNALLYARASTAAFTRSRRESVDSREARLDVDLWIRIGRDPERGVDQVDRGIGPGYLVGKFLASGGIHHACYRVPGIADVG